MAKEKSVYTCSECGGTSPKWLGKCPSCNAWNTLIESVAQPESLVKNRFASLATDGLLLQTTATPEEIRDNDLPDMPRVSLKYAAKGFTDLRGLINALNEF